MKDIPYLKDKMWCVFHAFFHENLPWCIKSTVWYPINSLAPGRSGCNFENVVFKLALLICIFKSSYDNVARWIPQEPTDSKSTLVQLMAWCHQATSHYLSQCWPRSMSPYGFTRPQRVKMCTWLHCAVYCGTYIISYFWIHVIYLPISFRVTSLALQ